MIRKTRLFTPGPTPLLPAAQFAMAAADIHHRTAEFRALYTRVLAQLKEFVGTTNDVILLSSSGTGAMEASVSNLTSPGDRVLILTAGKFGERWSGLCQSIRLPRRRRQRALRPDLLARRSQSLAPPRNPRRLHASHRDLDRRPPLRSRRRQAPQRRAGLRSPPHRRRHHRPRHHPPRHGRLGCRRPRRRLPEGRHDSLPA